MNDRNLHPPASVNGFGQKALGSWAVEALQSKTSETARHRILEHARTLRNHNFAIGVEILPTHLVAVLTDPTGQPYTLRRHELPGMEVDTVVREIGEVVRELAWTSLGIDGDSRRVAVGLQIGGPVDTHEGVVLAWRNHRSEGRYARHAVQWKKPVPLASMVAQETGFPTCVENDAAAYAAHELRFRTGFEDGAFAVILVRDGIGGGIVRDHRVMQIPFEIGHLIVHPGGRECSCGNVGCIEAYAGGRAIRGIVGSILKLSADPDDIRGAIDLAASHGVSHVFKEAGEAIARGVATIVTLFGVGRVVLYCDPDMCDVTKNPVAMFFAGVETYTKHAFHTFGGCRIDRKEWRSTDGAVGAALVALNQLFYAPLAFAGPTA